MSNDHPAGVAPIDWVSVRLREAGNILVDRGCVCAARSAYELLFSLADLAENLERAGVNPIRDQGLSMVFSNATIFAARIVQEEQQVMSRGAV